jgi:hypothetical protein
MILNEYGIGQQYLAATMEIRSISTTAMHMVVYIAGVIKCGMNSAAVPVEFVRPGGSYMIGMAIAGF